MAILGYDPNNATQQSFLSALALGESGGASNAATLAYGGGSTAGDVTDEFGFPQWAGLGNSHAAGIYQFEPDTWDSVAGQLNLNFANPQDQNAGAWYVAQQTYQQKTGGDLSSALSSGNYSGIQSALASVWPSVAGNAASPTGLAGALSSGAGAAIPGATQAGAVGPTDASAGGSTSILGNIENWFERFGLIAIGGLVIIAALWALLSNAGYVPSAKHLVKSAI